MDDIRGALPVVNEEGKVGRFSQVGHPARVGDWGPGEFGFHDQIGIRAAVDFLLPRLRLGEVDRGRSIGCVVWVRRPVREGACGVAWNRRCWGLVVGRSCRRRHRGRTGLTVCSCLAFLAVPKPVVSRRS